MPFAAVPAGFAAAVIEADACIFLLGSAVFEEAGGGCSPEGRVPVLAASSFEATAGGGA